MTGLAADFPRVSEADWRALAGRLSLPRDSAIAPVQPAANGTPIPSRAPGAAWTVIARVAGGPDAPAINTRIRDELEGGANGIELVFAPSPSAHGGGLEATVVDWAGLMNGVRLAGTVFRVDAGEASANMGGELIAFAKRA